VINPVSKLQNTYWSSSKCENELQRVYIDNGRVLSADEMIIYAADYDWDTFTKAYNFDSIEVLELYKAEADYLPLEMIDLILTMYNYKTTLKGVEGAESKYKESKEFINSLYGCLVTKIVTDPVLFMDGDWMKTDYDMTVFTETLSHEKVEKTFGSYQLGIWVTAIARYNLWRFIIKFDTRIVYCDTDSFKGDFTDDDLAFVDEYNKYVEELENKVALHYGFDPNLYAPKNPKGKVCRLGVADREHDCILKTLGAKRYCVEEDGELHMTVAGLPKKSVSKLKSLDDFNNNTFWNVKESGKKCSYYNDNQSECVWIDEDGKAYNSSDKYGIAIIPTSFNMSMSDEFRMLIELMSGNVSDDDFFNDMPSCLY
jgi:hypothetical protein